MFVWLQDNHLHQHEDFLIAQLVRQLEFLNHSNHPEVVNCYKKNLGLLVKVSSQIHENLTISSFVLFFNFLIKTIYVLEFDCEMALISFYVILPFIVPTYMSVPKLSFIIINRLILK